MCGDIIKKEKIETTDQLSDQKGQNGPEVVAISTKSPKSFALDTRPRLKRF